MDFLSQDRPIVDVIPGPATRKASIATGSGVDELAGAFPSFRAGCSELGRHDVAGAHLIEESFWLLQRSRNPAAALTYNNRRMLQAARQAGLSARFVNMQEAPIGAPAFLVPRSGTRLRRCDLARIAAWERAGTSSLNTSAALSLCRDKARMTEVLQRFGCAMPATWVVKRKNELFSAVEQVGFPCVVKPLRGSKGRGVQLCRDWNDLWLAYEALRARGLLVQAFIAEAAGRDTRVLILDGEILGGMERNGPGGDFRSNAALGGPVRAATLSPDLKRLAFAAAKAFGLRFAGVDLLLTRDGPLVCEVNSAPGFEAFETATGVKVAEHLVDALVGLSCRASRPI